MQHAVDEFRPRPGASLTGPHDVGSAEGLRAAGRLVARLGATSVLVVQTRRGLFAVENKCPHAHRRLTDAVVSGQRLICTGHGRKFDLVSGQPLDRGRRTRCMRRFDVAVTAGRIWVTPMDREPVAVPSSVVSVPDELPALRQASGALQLRRALVKCFGRLIIVARGRRAMDDK